MTTTTLSRLALASAAVLALSAPARAATIPVFAWDSAPPQLTCVGSCSLSVPFDGGNLIAPTPAGYQGLGFDTAMVHNYAAGNPAGPVTIWADSLPAHDSLNLAFLLAIIDSWDGNTPQDVAPDRLNITVDGVSIYSETYDNFALADQSAPTANLMSFGTQLGFSPSWNDSAYDFTGANGFLNVPHTASSFQILIFASGAGWQAGDDESFGLDRIRVSVNTDDVPEPGSLALLGISVLGLGVRLRKTAR